MKKIILLCCMSLAVLAVYSQHKSPSDSNPVMKSEKQHNTELKKAKEEAAAKIVETMLTDKQFVMEVDFMNDQGRNYLHSGGWITVNRMGNFIAVNSDKIVLQFEPDENQTSNWPFEIFPNNDTFSKYEIIAPQKSGDSYTIKFRTNGKVGPYDVTMFVTDDGKTEMTIKSNNGLSLKFRGIIVPLSQSKTSPVFI